jgi:hypothetical protein
MGAEIIKGLNSKNEPEFFRVPDIKTNFSSSSPIPDGSSLESEIVLIEGYQHVVSELEADQNCTIQYQWYADQAGAQSLGNINYNYTTGSGTELIWESVSGPYLKINISNSSGVDMTRFWHRLRLTNTPMLSTNIANIDDKLILVQTEINDELLATRNTIESVGEELEVQINLVTTEINDELLATRNTIETALTIEHPRIVRAEYGQIGIDAGGRQRVSQLTTLMDGKVVNGHTPLIFESAGTGTQTVGNSKNNMAVTSGQWSIFQTKRFYPYFSGKSQTVECTFDSFAPQADVVKRFGYFSSNAVSPFDATYDGMWCENTGTSIRLRMARAGTSTLDVDITNWTGYADLGEYQNLATWDNFTVCIFDFLWLGGAVMRFWVKAQSGFILAHVFRYAGTAPDVFMLEPCKPLRYEIRSSTGSGSFRYICSQIATEGSFEEDGIVRAVTTGVTAIACTTIGTTYPLIAIRKQSAYRCVASRLSDFNIFVSSANDRMLYTVQINPTLSAPLTYADVVNSSVQSAIGNGTITVTTPGIIMATGFLAQNSILPSGLLEHNFLSYMGGTLANVMDEYILCGTPITSGVDTYSSLAYKEY